MEQKNKKEEKMIRLDSRLILSHLFAILIYAAVLYMYVTIYAILNKCENATRQYSMFCDKVLDENYLLIKS